MERFREYLGSRFVFTAEVNPPRGTDLAKLLTEVERLRGHVDAIDITDSSLARMKMSSIALAVIIKERFGIDPIFNLACRDRNVIAIQSELLGASALGLENVLAITGDAPERRPWERKRVEKPWGHEEVIGLGPEYVARSLHIRKGERDSLRYFTGEGETVFLHSGAVTLKLQEGEGKGQALPLRPGDGVHLAPGIKYKLEVGEDSELFQVSLPELGEKAPVKPVFQVDSVGLIKLIATLNAGSDHSGATLEGIPSFFIGTTANPGARNLEGELNKLGKKVEAGAAFVLTQPVYEAGKAREFMREAKGFSVPVLFGILPLKSFKFANYLNKNLPGVSIPEDVLSRMNKESLGQQKAEAKAISLALFEAVAPYSDGVHLMPIGEVELALEIIKGIRSRL